MSDYTELPKLRILGPRGFLNKPLFELGFEVPWREKDPKKIEKPVVEMTADLRVLLQQTDLKELDRPTPNLRWDNSRLRDASVKFAPASLFTATGVATELSISDKKLNLERSNQSSVVQIAPVHDKWTASTPESRETIVTTPIRIPEMTLISGVISAEIKAKGGSDDLGLFQLNKSNGTIFGGLRVTLEKSNNLKVALTPDGIEFVAAVPPPIPNLDGWREDIPVTLLFTWDLPRTGDTKPRYQLRLVDADGPTLTNIETGMAALFGQLRTENAPLRIDFNTRLRVPPLSWRLNGPDKLAFEGTRAADNKSWTGWTTRLDGSSVRARLLTTAAQPQDVRIAEFKPESVFLRRVGVDQVQSKFEVTLSTAAEITVPEASCVWTRSDKEWTPAPVIKSELQFTIDAKAVADRLLPLYKAAHALSSDAKSPEFAFVPIERGWLQLPFDSGDDLKLDPPSDKPVDVLTGEVQLPFSVATETSFRSIQIQAASQLDASAQWKVDQRAVPKVNLQSVSLKFIKPQGTINGLLFFAETSPSALEILPTLQAGPIATSNLPLTFGPDSLKRSGLRWGGKISIADRSEPRIIFQLPEKTIVWRRFATLPAIPNIAMTRTAASATMPSQSRGLIPERLFPEKQPGEKPSLHDTPFTFDKERILPKLPAGIAFLKSWKWAWRGKGSSSLLPPNWGEDGVSLVLPTLPGLELAPEVSSTKLYSALRYDVPILDEFFAATQLPAHDQSASGPANGSGPTPPAPPTSLEPERLAKAWEENFQKLALARTQSAYLTPPVEMELANPVLIKVLGLVEPYIWNTNFQAKAATAAGPFGTYSLNKLSYEGESAIQGMKEQKFNVVGQELQVPPEGQNGELFAKNLAASRIRKSGMGQDSRGFSVADKPTVTAMFSMRDLPRKDNAERRLVTPLDPININLGTSSVKLWFRDLAMTKQVGGFWVFDGSQNFVEGVVGSQGQAFDPAHLPEALHEWRFFDDATHRFDISIEPFRFRPLRLWNLKLALDSANPLQKVSVLGRIILEPDRVQESGPFGADAAYDHGNLVLLEITPDQWSLNRITTGEPKGGLLNLVDSSDELRFCFEGVKLTGQETPVTVALGYKIPPPPLQSSDDRASLKDLTLSCRILGADCTLRGGTGTWDSNTQTLTVSFSNPSSKRECSLTGASLTVGLAKNSGPPVLKLDHEIRVAAVSPPQQAKGFPTVFKWDSQLAAAASWFGLELELGKPESHIDHIGGRISLSFTSEAKPDDFIAGLRLGDPKKDFAVRGAVQLILSLESNESWPIFKVNASHVRIEGDAGDTRIHHTVSYPILSGPGDDKAPSAVNSLTIDANVSRTSVIEWPMIDEVDNENEEKKGVANVEIIGAHSLVHRFSIRLHGHSFPLASLVMNGETLNLYEPWILNGVVSHSLSASNGNDQPAKVELKWSTLDQISVISTGKFREEVAAQRSEYAFVPFRYGGSYRGDPITDQMAHSGIAFTGLANSGFRDSHFVTELLKPGSSEADKEADKSELLVMGGSITSFIEETKQQRLTSMHYCASGNVTPLRNPFNRLAQARAEKLIWRLPTFDAADRPSEVNRLLPEPVKHSSHAAIFLDATEEEIGRILKGSVMQPFAAAIEQVFFEPKSESMKKLEPVVVPYFLRTLLVLRQAWDKFVASPERKFSTESVVASNKPTAIVSVAIKEQQFIVEVTPRPKIVALSRVDGVVVIEIQAEDADTNLTVSPAKLLSQARALVSRPVCVLVETYSEKQQVNWFRLDVPEGKENFGFRPPRRFSDGEIVPASGALGWPSGDRIGTTSRLSASIGEEGPVVSESAGLAGRAGVVGWPAYAPMMRSKESPGEPEALYHDFSAPVAFQRDGGLKDFRGPAPRHLSPTVNRRRAPLPEALGIALNSVVLEENKLTQHQKVPSGVAPITASQLEAGTVGLRPGVFHVFSASMTVPGEDSGFDPNFPRFGRPASSGPGVVSQLRSPRGTSLPLFEALATRRRTYLSRADKTGDTLSLFRAFKGPAAVFRLQRDEKFWRFIMRPEKVNLGPNWDGEIALRLETAVDPGPQSGFWPTLYALGLLPLASTAVSTAEAGKSTAPIVQLVVGDDVFHFRQLTWVPPSKDDFKSVTVSLFMTDDLLRARESLQVANGDTAVRLLLQFAPAPDQPSPPKEKQSVNLGGSGRTTLTPGPPLTLVLPLQVAVPDRPALPLSTTTIAFADPSYDRQLGSPAQINTQIRDNEHFQLALDRSQYDFDAAIYFAFGMVVPDDDMNLRFKSSNEKAYVFFQRHQATSVAVRQTEPQFLTIDGTPPFALTAYQIDEAQPYVIPLRAFRQDGVPVRWQSDDQLIVHVSDTDPKTKPDARTISIEVRVRIVSQPQIAPAASVFSVVGCEPTGKWADVPLHACAPLPQRIEFPDLLGDLATGHVRRQGLFIWSWTEVSQKRKLTLIKMDRSGAAQIPLNHFQEPW